MNDAGGAVALPSAHEDEFMVFVVGAGAEEADAFAVAAADVHIEVFVGNGEAKDAGVEVALALHVVDEDADVAESVNAGHGVRLSGERRRPRGGGVRASRWRRR